MITIIIKHHHQKHQQQQQQQQQHNIFVPFCLLLLFLSFLCLFIYWFVLFVCCINCFLTGPQFWSSEIKRVFSERVFFDVFFLSVFLANEAFMVRWAFGKWQPRRWCETDVFCFTPRDRSGFPSNSIPHARKARHQNCQSWHFSFRGVLLRCKEIPSPFTTLFRERETEVTNWQTRISSVNIKFSIFSR